MTCLLGFILSVLATLVPSLIAIAILWWLDRYEKEPLWLLSIIFFWGAIPTVIMALIAQIVLDVPVSFLFGKSILYSLTNLSIIAPLTEETFKSLIILIIFFVYRREFDSVMDGILYGALVGFGFSVVEDVLYFMSSLLGEGWGGWGMTVALRVGLYNLNHAMFTACVGIGFGLARNSKEMWKKVLFPITGWIAAMVLHGIHNGGTALAEQTYLLSCLGATFVDWIGVVAMLIFIILSLRQEKRWFDELEPEVNAGVVTSDEYQVASSARARFARGWQVLTRHGPVAWFKWSRFVQLIVDLAYKKHQKEAAGEGEKTAALIAGLRQRIAQMRVQVPVIKD
ncbi:MAG: PrsW family intramembrane metalloprotease [Anaerolineae bacterium]|nr:PrsW family intramembrane metalloprotease [Anaerolineae bacterium]